MLSWCLLPLVSCSFYPFNNVSLPANERAADLLQRMNLHEKVGQLFMGHNMAWGNDTNPHKGQMLNGTSPRVSSTSRAHIYDKFRRCGRIKHRH